MIFSSLLFHGIPPHAAADCSHTLFSLSSPDSLSTNSPAYPDSSIESHYIPSVVFTRVCHPRFRSTDFSCSLLSSFVFRCLRRRHSSSTNRTLFSNQSSLPLVPFPGNRRPRRFKQQMACTFVPSRTYSARASSGIAESYLMRYYVIPLAMFKLI